MYDSIIHSGILGMRWGIRRYQNKDGSLTAEGKKRRRDERHELQKDKPKVETEKEKIAKMTDKEKIAKMTDDELRQKIARFELETRYSNMLKQMNPKKTSRIKKLVSDIMYDSVKKAGTEFLSKELKNILDSLQKDIKKSGGS